MPTNEECLREIGRRVARLRQARGMTQRELARAARLSESYVFRMERGSNVSVSTLLDVARALEVPIAAFFRLDSPRRSPPASAREPMELSRPQMREPAIERVSSFIQELRADERKRAIRLLRAAFPPRKQAPPGE